MGLTLIELLGGHCDLAILVAMLLPALGKPKAKVKQISCLNDLCRIGLATAKVDQAPESVI